MRSKSEGNLFPRCYRPLGVDSYCEVVLLDVRLGVAVAAVVHEGVGEVQDGAVGVGILGGFSIEESPPGGKVKSD